MAEYKLKTPRFVENTVVKAYQSVETGVVGAYKKIEDKFVNTFLEKAERREEHGATQPSHHK